MAILNSGPVGAQIVAGGETSLFRQVIRPGGTAALAYTMDFLACDQLPHLKFYVDVTSPGALAPYFFDFEFSMLKQDNVNAPLFFPLGRFLLPVGNIIDQQFNQPASFIRMTANFPAVPGAQAVPETINMVLGAFAT